MRSSLPLHPIGSVSRLHPKAAPAGGPRLAARGFTLLEILVALAILGLLVGLAIVKTNGIFSTSEESIAGIYINSSLKTPLHFYQIQIGDFPSTSEGLQALMTAPAGKSDKWKGPYITEEIKWPPVDPWGEPYQYRYPGTHNKGGYDLWSKGPDHQDGTADDIGNWLKESTETPK
jgi:general secretion pathway protein G